MSEEQYVYDGTLVKKTGRRAVKQKPDNSNRRRSVNAPDQYVYEIEPAESEIIWKKWVKEEELYVILDDEEQHGTIP